TTLEAPVRRVVLLSVETGQTVWSVDGRPCSWPEDDETVVAVCVDSGTVSYTRNEWNDTYDVTPRDQRRHVVGVDIKTGKTTWRFPANGQGPAVPDDDYPDLVAPAGHMLTWSDGLHLVEVVSGKPTPLADAETYLCWADEIAAVLVAGGTDSVERTFSRRVWEICDADGLPTEAAAWPVFFLTDATHDEDDDDGLYFVATAGQLAAFRL
ncbi:MAG: hypothetical protein FWE61_09675, partial [Micrococcales bacterium]|nr:hypothetical protein [Micrococcales bacterium]